MTRILGPQIFSVRRRVRDKSTPPFLTGFPTSVQINSHEMRTHTHAFSRSRNVSRKNDPLRLPVTRFFPHPEYTHTSLIKKDTK